MHSNEYREEKRQSLVVLLYGAPACGKLTIARELARTQNLFLLDNHHFNDVVMPFVDVNSNSLPDINEAVYKIRSLALDILKKYKKSTSCGFIFTNVLLESDADKEAVLELQQFANDMNAHFIPIHLTCSLDVLIQRVQNEERKTKGKLTDPVILKSFLENQKMIDMDHPNKITLDTSDISVSQAIEQITHDLEKF